MATAEEAGVAEGGMPAAEADGPGPASGTGRRRWSPLWQLRRWAAVLGRKQDDKEMPPISHGAAARRVVAGEEQAGGDEACLCVRR